MLYLRNCVPFKWNFTILNTTHSFGTVFVSVLLTTFPTFSFWYLKPNSLIQKRKIRGESSEEYDCQDAVETTEFFQQISFLLLLRSFWYSCLEVFVGFEVSNPNSNSIFCSQRYLDPPGSLGVTQICLVKYLWFISNCLLLFQPGSTYTGSRAIRRYVPHRIVLLSFSNQKQYRKRDAQSCGHWYEISIGFHDGLSQRLFGEFGSRKYVNWWIGRKGLLTWTHLEGRSVPKISFGCKFIISSKQFVCCEGHIIRRDAPCSVTDGEDAPRN